MTGLTKELATVVERRADGAAPALLAVDQLNVLYAGKHGQFHAVRDATFSIARGEQVALVGESGSGKTTLGMAVAGFISPSTGASITSTRFEFDGSPMVRHERSGIPHRTPGIAMVFQDAMTSLDPVWTVGSQLRAVLRGTGAHSRSAVRDLARDWLHRVGLTNTKRVLSSRPYELSGGMRQRAMLAIALSGAPRLLIADEPTSALDATLSRSAMDLLRGLAIDTGTSLLIVSHDIKLCQEYSDRMLVMYRGQIVEQGRSAELAQSAEHPYTKALLRCIPNLDNRNVHRLPVLADFLAAASNTNDTLETRHVA